MRPALHFFVCGTPRPAGSKRGFPIYRGKGKDRKFSGHVAVTDACPKTKPWQATITADAVEAMGAGGEHGQFTGPVTLRLVFHIARPKYHFGTGRNMNVLKGGVGNRPVTKPDLLKLARAVEDAITDSGVWRDDSQVVIERLEKVYALTPGVDITIEEAD